MAAAGSDWQPFIFQPLCILGCVSRDPCTADVSVLSIPGGVVCTNNAAPRVVLHKDVHFCKTLLCFLIHSGNIVLDITLTDRLIVC